MAYPTYNDFIGDKWEAIPIKVPCGLCSMGPNWQNLAQFRYTITNSLLGAQIELYVCSDHITKIKALSEGTSRWDSILQMLMWPKNKK